MTNQKLKVVLTDHPWPDVAVEQAVFNAAGIDLIAGPIEAPSAEAVEAVVAAHDPQAIMCCWAHEEFADKRVSGGAKAP